ncbi:hypothetical protein QN084_06245 [Paenarthrobacter sp. R1]|uniref:hypothetical protein n=1 Tax=Paenarthrobacter sp. R1 TaxID=3049085 RepID=UPI002554890A|nr:hypothetical protein [Paenarthrobacter sp. R1]WIV32208.1 hypothetical protein QN084_06245 [Paenarthrobacter sp. R1]
MTTAQPDPLATLLAAADAVMFSDEAIERAAREVSWVKLPFGGRPDSFVQLDANAAHAAVKIIVAALKCDA